MVYILLGGSIMIPYNPDCSVNGIPEWATCAELLCDRNHRLILGVLAPSAGRTGQHCDIKTEDQNLTCFLRFLYRCFLAKFFCFFWKTLGKRRSIEKAKITVMCKYHKNGISELLRAMYLAQNFPQKNRNNKKKAALWGWENDVGSWNSETSLDESIHGPLVISIWNWKKGMS